MSRPTRDGLPRPEPRGAARLAADRRTGLQRGAGHRQQHLEGFNAWPRLEAGVSRGRIWQRGPRVPAFLSSGSGCAHFEQAAPAALPFFGGGLHRLSCLSLPLALRSLLTMARIGISGAFVCRELILFCSILIRLVTGFASQYSRPTPRQEG